MADENDLITFWGRKYLCAGFLCECLPLLFVAVAETNEFSLSLSHSLKSLLVRRQTSSSSCWFCMPERVAKNDTLFPLFRLVSSRLSSDELFWIPTNYFPRSFRCNHSQVLIPSSSSFFLIPKVNFRQR